MSSDMHLEVPEPRALGDVIRDVCGGDKNLLFKIMDETGEVRPHVAIFVGNEHCKYLGGLDAMIDPNDEVSIFPALSGG
jgi:molybdopterin converting factor small subunit